MARGFFRTEKEKTVAAEIERKVLTNYGKSSVCVTEGVICTY